MSWVTPWRDSISIHALHEESDSSGHRWRSIHCISIHALHEESDSSGHRWRSIHCISIHALHEESDAVAVRPMLLPVEFQSTLSMRRATVSIKKNDTPENKFQSTLSMRRATFICTVGGISLIISIHALHEESDLS